MPPQKNATVAMVPSTNEASANTSSAVEIPSAPLALRRHTSSAAPSVWTCPVSVDGQVLRSARVSCHLLSYSIGAA